MKKDILTILKECGMILEGHFIGKRTGRHFNTFIVKENLLNSGKELNMVCDELSIIVKQSWCDVEVIVGPVTGGSIIAALVAAKLSNEQKVGFAPIEKTRGGRYYFRKEYARLIESKNIVIIEDVIRSGETMSVLEKEIERIGGKLLGIAVVLNRSNPTKTKTVAGTNFKSLIDFKEDGYEEGQIPSWLEKIPLNKNFGGPRTTTKVIGITGRIGSGKSTLIKELLKRLPSAERVASSDILKETLLLWNLPETRKNLLFLSQVMRVHYKRNITVDVVVQRISNSDTEVVIIDGIRGNQIYEILNSYKKSLLIAVQCDSNKRYERIKCRTDKKDETKMSHGDFLSLEKKGFQKELDNIESRADIYINNNGNKNILLQQLEGVLKRIENL